MWVVALKPKQLRAAGDGLKPSSQRPVLKASLDRDPAFIQNALLDKCLPLREQ